MFERIADFLFQVIHLFQFACIVHAYERGVVLRWGRYHRTIAPGLHLFWPLGIETAITDHVVRTTSNLGPQSLTTKDGQSVTVAGLVTWQVSDVRRVLLEVEGKQEVLLDTAYGVIARHVTAAADWSEVTSPELADAITREVRRKGRQCGIRVFSVQFSDLAKCTPLRIWGAPTAQPS